MLEPLIVKRRDQALVCAGKLPSTGLHNKRYILPGDAKNPAVRIWPGLWTQRTVVIGQGNDERTYPCTCSIRDSQLGPVFVLLAKPGREERTINAAGRTMTACVRTSLTLLADDADSTWTVSVTLARSKALSFFGFRTKANVSTSKHGFVPCTMITPALRISMILKQSFSLRLRTKLPTAT